MALFQATKESLWIQHLLDKLGQTVENPNIIYANDQGAIALAHNPEHHAPTKHVDIEYHFVRDCAEDRTTRLEYCPTEDMVADDLTKTLRLERHMMGMGVWQKSEDYAITKVGEKNEEEREEARCCKSLSTTTARITRMRSGSDERLHLRYLHVFATSISKLSLLIV
jgi:hypothetical protein